MRYGTETDLDPSEVLDLVEEYFGEGGLGLVLESLEPDAAGAAGFAGADLGAFEVVAHRPGGLADGAAVEHGADHGDRHGGHQDHDRDDHHHLDERYAAPRRPKSTGSGHATGPRRGDCGCCRSG